jgi:hypothetical protein
LIYHSFIRGVSRYVQRRGAHSTVQILSVNPFLKYLCNYLHVSSVVRLFTTMPPHTESQKCH